MYVATLGAFSWDIFTTVAQDWRLLTEFSFSLPTAVYFVSRLAAWGQIWCSVIFAVAPVGNCQTLQYALGSLFAIAVPANSLLFFFRIRAVFDRQRWVVWCFGILWLCVLGGSLTIPFAIFGIHIGPTQYCVNSLVKSYASTGVVVSTVNDTLVFLAISWSILSRQRTESRAKSFFKGGSNLPVVSHALLSGGQLYYFITIFVNLVTTIMLMTPSVPPVLRAICTVPNIGLENAMACRVFRDLKLGLSTDSHTNQSSLPIKASSAYPMHSYGQSQSYGGHTQTDSAPIHFHKTVEQMTVSDSLPRDGKPSGPYYGEV
jgi:hypothetical protein